MSVIWLMVYWGFCYMPIYRNDKSHAIIAFNALMAWLFCVFSRKYEEKYRNNNSINTTKEDVRFEEIQGNIV